MISDIKVGVLYLQSSQYKTMSRDFIRGIKMNNLPVQYIMESIGIGSNDRLVMDKIQKLHHQEDVNFIVAFLGHYNTKAIYEYASENEIILIASDLGATLPYDMDKHKGVYINSYSLNETSYLLGEYLAEKGIEKTFSSTSYYDSGYGILAAAEMGLKKKNLNFSGHYITPFNPRDNEEVIMEQTISGDADAVFAFHSGLYAEEHAEFMSKINLIKNITYYITPFSVKKKLYVKKLNNTFVVASWIENDTDAQNCSFTEKYMQEYNNDTPNIFALLGYENGLILKTILEKDDSHNSYQSLLEKMEMLTAEGPRGTIFFEKNTNRTVFNHYIYKIVTNDENNFSYQKMETLKNDGHFIQNILFTKPPEKLGGWHNAYLCH